MKFDILLRLVKINLMLVNRLIKFQGGEFKLISIQKGWGTLNVGLRSGMYRIVW